jgi:hypothetical protein
MALKKLAPVLIIWLIISCKKPEQKHVWVYDGWKGEVEMLNGPVKEIYQGDSTGAGTYFKRIDFDENWEMVRREDLLFDEPESNGAKNLPVRTYKIVLDKEGRKIGMLNNDSSIWKVNRNGQIVSYSPRIEDAVAGRYYYDKNGDMIRYTSTSGNNCCGEVSVFKYDHLHRIGEINWGEDLGSGSDGAATILKTTSRYLKTDSEGNWIVAVDYDQNLANRKDASHTEHYNAQNNLL